MKASEAKHANARLALFQKCSRTEMTKSAQMSLANDAAGGKVFVGAKENDLVAGRGG